MLPTTHLQFWERSVGKELKMAEQIRHRDSPMYSSAMDGVMKPSENKDGKTVEFAEHGEQEDLVNDWLREPTMRLDVQR
jgi:hypothetical protein